ncbi:MAG: hypothetical protein WHS46_07120 [Desulfosoma sp.]
MSRRGVATCLVPKGRKELRETVQDYFTRQDRRYGVYAVTGAGEFVPSSLSHVYLGLSRLMAEGMLHGDHVFLDAGSGDGRVLVLASLVLGLKTYGVEYDEALWERSLKNIAFFGPLYSGPDDFPTVLCGDFCDEKTYIQANTSFVDFDVVFNYANNHVKLAEKIARDGSDHVLFLYYGPSPLPETFPSLHPLRTLPLGPQGSSAGPFLHVYGKDQKGFAGMGVFGVGNRVPREK